MKTWTLGDDLNTGGSDLWTTESRLASNNFPQNDQDSVLYTRILHDCIQLKKMGGQ